VHLTLPLPALRAPVLAAQPALFCRERFDTYKGDTHGEHGIKFAKGTTTLSFIFKGGVIVSVDSRATQGPFIGT
jgi:20S proteasome subunit beta 5